MIIGEIYKVKDSRIRGKLIDYDHINKEARIMVLDGYYVTKCENLVRCEYLGNSCCERCGKKTNVKSFSVFNTEVCCMDCLEKEKKHKLYKIAKHIENEEIKISNLNFQGIGLPHDLTVGFCFDMSPEDEDKYLKMSKELWPKE